MSAASTAGVRDGGAQAVRIGPLRFGSYEEWYDDALDLKMFALQLAQAAYNGVPEPQKQKHKDKKARVEPAAEPPRVLQLSHAVWIVRQLLLYGAAAYTIQYKKVYFNHLLDVIPDGQRRGELVFTLATEPTTNSAQAAKPLRAYPCAVWLEPLRNGTKWVWQTPYSMLYRAFDAPWTRMAAEMGFEMMRHANSPLLILTDVPPAPGLATGPALGLALPPPARTAYEMAEGDEAQPMAQTFTDALLTGGRDGALREPNRVPSRIIDAGETAVTVHNPHYGPSFSRVSKMYLNTSNPKVPKMDKPMQMHFIQLAIDALAALEAALTAGGDPPAAGNV